MTSQSSPLSAAPSSGIAYDPQWTVNELLQRHPSVIGVLNAFGVDACCGGALTLAESAERDGLDLAGILHALAQAAPDEAR